MKEKGEILVVGTTPDYIDLIITKFKSQVIFLTDTETRKNHSEYIIPDETEILSDLKDHETSIISLKNFIDKHKLKLSGIICFDCESMILTSKTAQALGLFYQTEESISISRNKFLSKEKWSASGLNTPSFSLLKRVSDALLFFKSINSPCVLKPLSGAGSELVFKCASPEELQNRFIQIERSLNNKRNNPLYDFSFSGDLPLILAEEFIDGTEYSCDFVYEKEKIKIIRLTRKIKIAHLPFGIIAGYEILNSIPGISHEKLEETLSIAAKAAGITKAITMVDFIIKNQAIYLIEIAPRPGGDCLPHLFYHASGIDMIELTIKHCAGLISRLPDYRELKQTAALRIFASKNGKLASVNISELEAEPEIKSIQITAACGSQIKLPPENYDSWILGSYILNENNHDRNYEMIFREFSKKIRTEIVQ